jgi:hypothetical protein
MTEERIPPSPVDDFATLASWKAPGEALTPAEYAAAERTVNRYWPKFGEPRELPEEYR